LVVADAVIDALEGLHLSFPKVDEEKRKELDAARAALADEPENTEGERGRRRTPAHSRRLGQPHKR
jgi:hypothetical protein